MALFLLAAFLGFYPQEIEDKRSLKEISDSCEWYYRRNRVYPASEAVLLASAPPYLNSGYCGLTLNGYIYTCTFAPAGYMVMAVPARPSSGKSYTISTHGVVE